MKNCKHVRFLICDVSVSIPEYTTMVTFIELSKKLDQMALERDRAERDVAWGWVWILESWSCACTVLRNFWSLSCDLMLS